MQPRMTLLWPALAVAAIVSPAWAQTGVKDVEPYVAVVTTDKAAMRGSDAAFYYPVRELKLGELVRVNGEGPGWVRAEYLPGMRAYVSASDVEAAKDGKTVKLIKPSQLMAFDASANPKAPWWPLDIEKALPTGTVLDVISVQKAADEVVQGYVVPAPSKARGYISKEHVRKASAEEAAKFASTTVAATTPAKPDETKQPDKPAAAAGTPTDAAAVKPATSPDVKTPAASTDTTTTPAGFTPVTPVTSTPATTPTGTPTTPSAPTPAVSTPPVRPAPPAAPKVDEELVQIRTMFDKTMAAQDDAELPVVISMFDRKMAKLGSTPAEETLKTQLGQRLAALKLRQDINAESQRIKNAAAQNKGRVDEVILLVEQAQKQAIYTVVGRIVPSTVYDGKRGLPLMFRVQSADALAPRTVGYILPKDGVDLTTKLGQVCGVVGETRFDDSLQLNIVVPRRVDVLGVNSTTNSPAPVPAANVSVPTETTPVPAAEPEK